jgi:adenine-specific DNA-methyltransferase
MNIYNNNYAELKTHYDETYNKDKSTYKNSNDEPTPIGCIEEMLEKIPQSAWNPKMKILDPCCGNGNFHLYAWNKLKELGIDDEDIVKNNLFFNDINFKRLENVRQVYGEDSNITLFDFLRYPEDEKYDIIYANPPYAKFTKEGKRASKNHTMVRDFLDKSLKMLKTGGFLVYIIPDNWMSLADRNLVIKELTANQILHLNIHGAKKWFPKIGSSFTWMVLEKKAPYKDTRVECRFQGKEYTSNIRMSKRSFVPLLWTKEVRSIFSKTIDKVNQKYAVQTSSDLHKYTKKKLISDTKTHEFSHKLIHTPSTTVWANRKHKFQDGYKCFISTTSYYGTFVDDCGMTQSIAFIRCKDKTEAGEIKSILDHDLYKFLNNVCRWGNFNNIRILQKFPVPKDANSIYDSFGITADEIDFIEKVLKKT